MAKSVFEFGGESNNNWKKGIGTFKFHPNDESKVKLIMENENYTFRDKQLPDYPKRIREGQEYFVEFRVDDDGDIQSIDNIRPAKWMGLKMKAVDMTRPDPDKLEPPSFYTYKANYSGKEVEEKAFYIFYMCIDETSEYYGCLFPNRYFYKFENDGNGKVRLQGDYDNPKATRLHRVADHISVLLRGEPQNMDWPDDGNILPELLARILAAGVVVETAGGSKYASISEMMESKMPVKDNAPIPSEEKRHEKEPSPFDNAVKDKDW